MLLTEAFSTGPARPNIMAMTSRSVFNATSYGTELVLVCSAKRLSSGVSQT